MEKLDYYKLLNVEKSATEDQIKKAYRELMRKWHPDKVNKESEREATQMTCRINEAYETLSDKSKRTQYDQEQQQETPKLFKDFYEEQLSKFGSYRKFWESNFRSFEEEVLKYERFSGSFGATYENPIRPNSKYKFEKAASKYSDF
jgi:curved DNA-binding protein CbpA